jgi:plastocyanin
MRKVLPLLTALGIIAAPAVPAIGAPPMKTVRVGDYFFSPTTVKIPRGTTVRWRWVGAIAHNLSIRNGPVKFHSPTQSKGNYSHVFTGKGTYLLHDPPLYDGDDQGLVTAQPR